MNNDILSFLPLGGIGDVTKNMYLYQYGDEILIVDCGIGFPDITTPGVDFLVPDITYLKKAVSQGKKIVGMLLTHGHEDHIGALPFILPSLPQFPIYGSQLTASLANEKLIDFGMKSRVDVAQFTDTLKIGPFEISLVRITHSIIDAANYCIRTPVGNFYHASDFKFDFTPVDGKPSELQKIAKFGDEGVLCLFSDCLGAERPGHSRSEMKIYDSFEEEFRKAKGKIIVTTYSSNISRLNQAIEVGIKLGRKVCFMGRSLLKARDIGRALGYMKFPPSAEIKPQDVKKRKPSEVLLLIAGSQAQENSALTRIAAGEDRDIKLEKGDSVIFSADPIPGNEVSINSLIDEISKRGVKVIYSEITNEFHVSGHGSQADLQLMISLTRPKYLLPIGATFRQMTAYRELAKDMGYGDKQAILIGDGQEILFLKDSYRFGQKLDVKNIFVDEITGEKVENFIIMDRVKISKEGMVIIVAEIDITTGTLVSTPDIITKGFLYPNKEGLAKKLEGILQKSFTARQEKVTNWSYFRKTLQQKTEEILYREGREPFVVPVVLEV